MSYKVLLKAARVHQWLKNILIFVPLILAHRVLDKTALLEAILAFFAFSLCASSFYVVNDLVDLEADRRHPHKRKRPFAAGDLTPRFGVGFAAALLALSAIIAFQLRATFIYSLLCYAVISATYSYVLKRIAIVDILVLAGLYTVRLMSGAFAVDVPISKWLLAFSMFIFLSLAYLKRYAELRLAKETSEDKVFGRGYLLSDLDIVLQFGTASGYLAVLVMALYVNSEEVRRLYSSPELLWLICPVLLYWISRVWFIASRGKLDDDPILFAIKDRVSYLAGAICAVIIFAAT